MSLRGRIRYVMYDQDNPKHVQDLGLVQRSIVKELQASKRYEPSVVDQFPGREAVIQYFKDKPAGYATFTYKGRKIHLGGIYVLPAYRDTVRRGPMTIAEKTRVEALKKFAAQIKKKEAALPKKLEQRLRAAHRAERGLAKPKIQLGLARKMVRWLANKYSAGITGFFLSPESKSLQPYTSVYEPGYFRRKGGHRPRPGRRGGLREY